VLHKSASVKEVLEAMRRLAEGEALLSEEEVVRLLRLLDRERAQTRKVQASFGRLTPREWDVPEALAEGMGDKEIAARLGVGVDTTRAHVARLLAKLEVRSRL
jgi:DNA-binding NarL/FixJ family response regulator